MEMSAVELIGPVGVRRFNAAKKCEANEGHEHNYDHATIVVAGRVQVVRRVVRNGVLEDLGTEEYGPGSVIQIPAKMRHTIKTLEDHTRYLCVFSHRDFDGLVSQEYVGNQAAYL